MSIFNFKSLNLNTGFEINACPLARGKLKSPRASYFLA